MSRDYLSYKKTKNFPRLPLEGHIDLTYRCNNNRRYFKIADITIQVDSDLPINNETFQPKFKLFETDGSGKDIISLRHHFSLPNLEGKSLGREVYRKTPWAIYKKGNSWIYLGISPMQGDKNFHRLVVFNSAHTRVRIYNDKEDAFLKGGLHSLTLFPSDQILLARILADRQGCYLHSCGVNFEGKGLLFIGHSDAGKSTMATMLKDKAEILCDDRMIVRRQEGEDRSQRTEDPERKPYGTVRGQKGNFRIYGTWSHGDVPQISSGSVPLKAIFFLNKANENYLELLKDRREINKRLLACLIKPFVTAQWWEKMLSLVESISNEVPCYILDFDKSGGVVDLLKQF